MKIDEMPAGPELDALVAERVMGWCECYIAGSGNVRGLHPSHGLPYTVPAYSRNTWAAFEVAEQVDLFQSHILTKNEDGKYIVCHLDSIGEWPEYYTSASESAALTICYAALKAVGVTEVPDTVPLAICRATLKAVDVGE